MNLNANIPIHIWQVLSTHFLYNPFAPFFLFLLFLDFYDVYIGSLYGIPYVL